jgi:hypothetical protein
MDHPLKNYIKACKKQEVGNPEPLKSLAVHAEQRKEMTNKFD